MFENTFETVIKGSNTIFLDISEKDFFLNYSTLSKEAAEEITNNYFLMKQKDGIPRVIDVSQDNYSHTIKITVEVDPYRSFSLDSNTVPDSLNVTRNQ